ncbi:MAG TPA: glycosyltransferase family 1 protein [Pyrinomonadaceae bacterium]|nr:glycosyltransferase family 1 protein [Pyrinomonadaceae bacterium]
MDVGLDGIPLSQSLTGVGHYTLELAHALARIAPEDRFELVSPLPSLHRPELPSNLHITQVSVNRLNRRFWWQVGLPRLIKRSRFSVFHGTNYSVPLQKVCPTVVTIHDLSLLLWPQTHEQHLARRARLRLPLMARRADAIIVPSQSVKTEVHEHLGIDEAKITVIPEAPRSSFWQVTGEEAVAVRRRLNIGDDFILFVGTIEPRKNLLTLVRAFEEIVRNGVSQTQLVLVGNEGWLTGELHDFLKTARFRERVRFVGYLADDDLRALYSSCRVFVYPSLYEGFGLPLLEAMACGAPVITSDIPSVRETVGDAALLVPPTDINELARSITRLLENSIEREQRSAAGKQHASKFSWEKAAAATLKVYQQFSRKQTRISS